MATVETAPIPHVRALWRPEQFTRVTNGTFESGTTGWSVSAGINGAGTAITQSSTYAHSGTYSGRLDVTDPDDGVNFDFGTEPFYAEATYGTVYTAVVWLRKANAGNHTFWNLTLGSEGTAADRSTLLCHVTTDWRPFQVLWKPSATRTDVQLAITSERTVASGYLYIDDVNVYQVDAFSQVENANFLSDTTGWSVGAGINAAGTSITQATGDGFAYATTLTYATLVTTGTSGSGANYDLGQRKFTSGRTYRARVALKSVSGSTSARLRLGSLGTGADRGDASVTITASWAWYLVDWTASGDRTDVELAVTNGSASAMTARLGAVEVYESLDEINGTGTGVRTDVDHIDWTNGSGTGKLNLTVLDARETRRFTPWNTSGALYGLLKEGRRVWARATYSGSALYPLGYGTIRRIVPDAQAGMATIMCEDPMYDLDRTDFSQDFAADLSYAEARAAVFSDAASPFGARRTDLTSSALESSTFYASTDGRVSALEYLGYLNDATGSAHYIAPDSRSEVLWRYTTVDRTAIYDATSSDETVDDDFHDLTGADLSDETSENRQVISWQSYGQHLPFDADSTGYGLLAVARVRTVYSDYDDDDPYLHFTDDTIGTDEGTPEPTYEADIRWSRKRKRKGKRKKTRVRTVEYRRIYPDGFVPVAAGADQLTPRTYVVDFAIPTSGIALVLKESGVTTGPDAYEVIETETEPRQATFTVTTTSAVSNGFDWFGIYGRAWSPDDERQVTATNYESVAEAGLRAGPMLNTPYIPSLGAAEGIGDYRNWRYATARMRPKLTLQHRFPQLLLRKPTEHLTINGALFSLSGAVFTITSVSGAVGQGGLDWSVDYELEELPTSLGTLFTIGTSALDGAHVIAY